MISVFVYEIVCYILLMYFMRLLNIFRRVINNGKVFILEEEQDLNFIDDFV